MSNNKSIDTTITSIKTIKAETNETISVLMCEPTAYALKYEINPWMRMENLPDIALAKQQWQKL